MEFQVVVRRFAQRALPVAMGAFVLSCAGTEPASDDPFAGVEGDDLAAAPVSAAELAGCADGAAGTSSFREPVVLCSKPKPTGALIQPPADSTRGTKFTFYASVVSDPYGGYAAFVLRDGRMLAPVNARGDSVEFTNARAFPAAMHMPTNHVVDTIFQVSGTLTGRRVALSFGAADAFRIRSARPVYQISGCSLDRRLLGTWVGDASERYATVQHPSPGPFGQKNFDDSKRVPLLIEFNRLTDPNLLAEYSGGVAIRDAATYVVRGTIRNFSAAVVRDGKTYPSLTAMGVKNPFHGATHGDVALYRSGNMHGLQRDAHWVFDYPAGSSDLTKNGMSSALHEQLAVAWLTAAPPPLLQAIKSIPHLPYSNNGQVVSLKPLAVGANVGTCPAP